MDNHHHAPENYHRAFAIGVSLNIIFVIIEGVYGVIAGSLALIADAGHNLSDVVSLLLAWGASVLSMKKPTQERTYGFRRLTIVASLISSVLLLFALGGIAWEAIGRFTVPQPTNGMVMLVVAGIGVIINGATALLFISGQHDLNIKAAYLHMAADAVVSLGVVVAAIAIIMTGWVWLDPAISLAIVVVVLVGTWGLLTDSLNLTLDAVPENVDIRQIRQYLHDVPGVAAIHDLHVWALSTTETALTVHLVVNQETIDNTFLQNITEALHERFHIGHATLQVEKNDDVNCKLDRPECH